MSLNLLLIEMLCCDRLGIEVKKAANVFVRARFLGKSALGLHH